MKKLTSLLLALAMALTLAPVSILAADLENSVVTEVAASDVIADVEVEAEAEVAAEAVTETAPAKGTPVASVAEGEYDAAQNVALSTDVEGAEIYYTTDGSEPTVNSQKYTKEIRISKTTTLKSIAVKDGETVGEVMRAVYTVNAGYFKLLIGLVADMMARNKA